MMSIDTEKDYDSVPYKIIWKYLEVKRVLQLFISIIQDMYSEVLGT